MRIHLLGAPGSGVSTLGKALAHRLQAPHFDTDDYHWFTEDALPFRRRRNPEHRRQLLSKDLMAQESWVLSGALCGWGDAFIPLFNRVIYVWLQAPVRLERITTRERLRYGAARIEPGGDLHGVFEKFLSWAEAYDTVSGNIRSREKELSWLKSLECPVCQIETEQTLEETVEIALNWLNKNQ